MTIDDHDRFTFLLTSLAETFGEPMSPARFGGYWLALEDLPRAVVEDAIRGALKRCKFFPRPAELRTLGGDAPPDAGLIERMIYEHLSAPGDQSTSTVGDPFVQLLVQRMGGMRGVSNMSSEDRLKLLDRLLPAVIQAAQCRGIPMPSEARIAVEHAEPPRLTLVEPRRKLTGGEEG